MHPPILCVIAENREIVDLLEQHDVLPACDVHYMPKEDSDQAFLEQADLVVVDGDVPGNYPQNISYLVLGESPAGHMALEKPFSFRNLVAHIARYLSQRPQIFTIGAVTFIPEKAQLVSENGIVDLTEMEAKLLYTILQSGEDGIERNILKRQVWGRDDLESHALETHIYVLRQKMGAEGESLVTTENGYKLC